MKDCIRFKVNRITWSVLRTHQLLGDVFMWLIYRDSLPKNKNVLFVYPRVVQNLYMTHFFLWKRKCGILRNDSCLYNLSQWGQFCLVTNVFLNVIFCHLKKKVIMVWYYTSVNKWLKNFFGGCTLSLLLMKILCGVPHKSQSKLRCLNHIKEWSIKQCLAHYNKTVINRFLWL